MSAVPVIAAGTFYPKSLFVGSVQGVWYDPSDLTTMFEDTDGATAVHTPGNGTADSPVALLLDKRTAGTNGNGKYNLFTYSEDFSNAAWSAFNVTKATSTITLTSTVGAAYQNPSGTAGGNTYKLQCKFKAGTNNYSSLNLQLSTGGNVTAVFDLLNGVVGETRASGSGWSVSSSAISDAGSGWWLCSMVATVGAKPDAITVGFAAKATGNTFDGYGNVTGCTSGNTLNVKQADLRLNSLASTLPTYQVVTSNWVIPQGGNYATQSTSTSRPTLSAKYNVLTYTEDFSNSVWNAYNVSKTASTITLTSGAGAAYQSWTVAAGTYSFSCKLKAGTNNYCYLNIQKGGGYYATAIFDLLNGATGETATAGGFTVTSSSITSLGSGWYLCNVVFTAIAAAANPLVVVGFAKAATGNTFDGTGNPTGCTVGNTLNLKEADFRFNNDGVGLPNYQKVVDANTYDSTNFPYYLKSDGVDDGQATASIDFTGTNKVTVFAGIRKLSDAALGAVAELSATIASNNGSFLLSAPNSAAANYNFSSKGTTQVDNTVITYTAPTTNVITGIGDISAPNNQIRVNGSVAGTQTGSQGTGNYGNYALYLFRRGGASAPFNGRTYGLIVRGASSTSTEISNTETWLNGKTKAY